MAKQAVGVAAVVLCGIALAITAFLAGKWSTSPQDVNELQRALGYSRWTVTIPDGAGDQRLSLVCRKGEREWSSGSLPTPGTAGQVVIYLRRDLYTKQLEYALLAGTTTERGTVEDPLSGALMSVDLRQATCRPGDVLLAGGARVESSAGGTQAECTVTLMLTREGTSPPTEN
jgi:hypothetical protein